MGATGPGVVAVVDPYGPPIAEAPSPVFGGLFSGSETNRAEQVLPGNIESAAMGTALMGPSPDGSERAVFVALLANGSVIQLHVEKGIEGLLPAGTITPITQVGPDAGELTAAATRATVVFNWVPDRLLFVADPNANSLVVLTLGDDGSVFRVEAIRRIQAPELSLPIDLSPAVPEVANPRFASNTTLAAGSDLYVLNRGNGTIVRLRQDGSVVAVRTVDAPGLGAVGPGRLNGIAVSADAQRIWVTVSGTVPDYPNAEGVLLELPAFGAPGSVGR